MPGQRIYKGLKLLKVREKRTNSLNQNKRMKESFQRKHQTTDRPTERATQQPPVFEQRSCTLLWCACEKASALDTKANTQLLHWGCCRQAATLAGVLFHPPLPLCPLVLVAACIAKVLHLLGCFGVGASEWWHASAKHTLCHSHRYRMVYYPFWTVCRFMQNNWWSYCTMMHDDMLGLFHASI